MEHLQMFDREWFKPEVASALREEMRPVMEKELNDYFTSPLEECAPEPHTKPLQQQEPLRTVQGEQSEPLQKKSPPPIAKTYQRKRNETRDLRSEVRTARGTRRKRNEVDYTDTDETRDLRPPQQSENCTWNKEEEE